MATTNRSLAMTRLNALAAPLLALALLTACEPSDRRPGLWLRGEVQPFPADMSFTEQHQEIAIQVSTPYFIPHSVTIWCATLGNQLYVAAAEPETKNWPGWVADNPKVRLKIGGRLFEARLERVHDREEIERVQAVYAEKYGLDPSRGGEGDSRYWRVEPRDDGQRSI